MPLVENAPAYVRWALPLLNDKRDYPFVALMMQCFPLTLVGLSLFFAGDKVWYLAVPYWIAIGVLIVDRFILMLHCTSHRQLFKRKYAWMNKIIPWYLGPFFGETPETYFAHHLGMHHHEGNLPSDLSSTMKYQRNKLTSWLRYWSRFMVFGIIELAAYFKRKGQTKIMKRLILGELSFVAVCVVGWWINSSAALVVFILPVIVVRTLMMAGNWGQHAFVCQEQPNNDYRSSITCINNRYNYRCFNDGYHIHHHVKASAHWSEHPGEFAKNIEVYGANDAIVFDGIDFFQVWLFLVSGSWNALAERFVQLPGAPLRDKAHIIEFLKSRMHPFKTNGKEWQATVGVTAAAE